MASGRVHREEAGLPVRHESEAVASAAPEELGAERQFQRRRRGARPCVVGAQARGRSGQPSHPRHGEEALARIPIDSAMIGMWIFRPTVGRTLLYRAWPRHGKRDPTPLQGDTLEMPFDADLTHYSAHAPSPAQEWPTT